MSPSNRRAPPLITIRLAAFWRQRWIRILVAVLALPVGTLSFAAGYYYVSFAYLIDARLEGARERVLPRIFARPLELRRGQILTEAELVTRLNELGYTRRGAPEKPGEFAADAEAVAFRPRAAENGPRLVRAIFQGGARNKGSADRIARLESDGKPANRLELEAPLLTALASGERAKRRPVELSAIPPHVVNAVLAIEDRRYYQHPGVDPIGIVRAILTNLAGTSAYVSGASTITQQVVRNVFIPQFAGWTLQRAREQSIRRKLFEQFVALILNTRASKDEILELYLNDMPLGQRGSFAIVGIAEASKLFFEKDVSNLTVSEAATLAGVLQAPSALSPFKNPDRCRERRNVVLQAMADAAFITQEAADQAAASPLIVVPRAFEAEAPYFVDYVASTLDHDYPGLATSAEGDVDVYTTLDPHLQHLAQEAVRTGLARVDEIVSRRRRNGRAEAALIAIAPRSGEILAMVGGRSYNQSQLNRAIIARRQPGSVFKPFVYLTAFERAIAAKRIDVTPASLVDDAPTTWDVNGQPWTPENYEREYDGVVTFRHALAHSRNLATIKVAEGVGYDSIVALWKDLDVGGAPRPYPSIALGAFEVTPYEIASAYTVFADAGTVHPLRHLLRVERGGKDITKKASARPHSAARPDAAFLVTNLMRAVINEGTGAGARAAGFTFDAAGKTGTTNDLRDAWFVGFTPTLLTVVWVGFDDNQPLGLAGSQAALPIWTQFMQQALAGTRNVPFQPPDGVSFVEIDPDTGKLALPTCPRVLREAFIAGTEPRETCPLHRF